MMDEAALEWRQNHADEVKPHCDTDDVPARGQNRTVLSVTPKSQHGISTLTLDTGPHQTGGHWKMGAGGSTALVWVRP